MVSVIGQTPRQPAPLRPAPPHLSLSPPTRHFFLGCTTPSPLLNRGPSGPSSNPTTPGTTLTGSAGFRGSCRNSHITHLGGWQQYIAYCREFSTSPRLTNEHNTFKKTIQDNLRIVFIFPRNKCPNVDILHVCISSRLIIPCYSVGNTIAGASNQGNRNKRRAPCPE